MVSGGDNLFTQAPQGGIKERAGAVEGEQKLFLVGILY